MLAMAMWTEQEKSKNGALESLCAAQVANNRHYLTGLFEVIKFLTINELPFRGSDEEIGELHSGLFLKLVEYKMGIDEKLAEISKSIPENAKYTQPQFQNEAIGMMAELVKEEILQEIQASNTGLFTIKCDKRLYWGRNSFHCDQICQQSRLAYRITSRIL